MERDYQDLNVRINRDPDTRRITKADLAQTGPGDYDRDAIQLNPFQLYGLVDAVAVADPDLWAELFPGPEQALAKVRDLLRDKGLENVELAGRSSGQARSHYLNVTEGLRQAVMMIQEELDGMANQAAIGTTAQDQVQAYHERSRA